MRGFLKKRSSKKVSKTDSSSADDTESTVKTVKSERRKLTVLAVIGHLIESSAVSADDDEIESKSDSIAKGDYFILDDEFNEDHFSLDIIDVSNNDNLTKFIKDCKESTSMNYDMVILDSLKSSKDYISICDGIGQNEQSKITSFVICFDERSENNALFRQSITKSCVDRAQMLTHSLKELTIVAKKILNRILNPPSALSDLSSLSIVHCPYPKCKIDGLSASQLWIHCPLYHIRVPNHTRITCPLCGVCSSVPFQVHLHNEHMPESEKKLGHIPEQKGGTDSYVFGLVLCRRPSDGCFLLTEEFASVGFWLPGGRVDSGEEPKEAAIRECIEEAGVLVHLKGLLSVQFRAMHGRREEPYNRMRFIFYAEPINDTTEGSVVKGVPDYESSGACWVTADQVLGGGLKLRSPEPFKWIQYLIDGGPIHDLSVLTSERVGI